MEMNIVVQTPTKNTFCSVQYLCFEREVAITPTFAPCLALRFRRTLTTAVLFFPEESMVCEKAAVHEAVSSGQRRPAR